MTIEGPFHASAPLWAEKTNDEKHDALSKMAHDLAAHAGRLGSDFARETIIPRREQLDQQRDALMVILDGLLGEARKQLHADLAGVTAADLAEARDIAEIQRLLTAHPDFPTVGCEVGHVTGSSLVVDVSKGTVLLHRHRKLNRWFQFGGHPDYELNMLDVARREAQEESGIPDLDLLTDFERERTPVDIELQQIPASAAKPAHVHADFRYVFTTKALEPRVSDGEESQDFWILTFDEALAESDAVIEPSVRRLIAKAQALAEKRQSGQQS